MEVVSGWIIIQPQIRYVDDSKCPESIPFSNNYLLMASNLQMIIL